MELVERLRNETSWQNTAIPYTQNCVYCNRQILQVCIMHGLKRRILNPERQKARIVLLLHILATFLRVCESSVISPYHKARKWFRSYSDPKSFQKSPPGWKAPSMLSCKSKATYLSSQEAQEQVGLPQSMSSFFLVLILCWTFDFGESQLVSIP